MSTVIFGKIIWQSVFETLERSTHAFKQSIKDETRTKWAATARLFYFDRETKNEIC